MEFFRRYLHNSTDEIRNLDLETSRFLLVVSLFIYHLISGGSIDQTISDSTIAQFDASAKECEIALLSLIVRYMRTWNPFAILRLKRYLTAVFKMHSSGRFEYAYA